MSETYEILGLKRDVSELEDRVKRLENILAQRENEALTVQMANEMGLPKSKPLDAGEPDHFVFELPDDTIDGPQAVSLTFRYGPTARSVELVNADGKLVATFSMCEAHSGHLVTDFAEKGEVTCVRFQH